MRRPSASPKNVVEPVSQSPVSPTTHAKRNLLNRPRPHAGLIVAVVFCTSLACLAATLLWFRSVVLADMPDEHLSVPMSMDDVRHMHAVLSDGLANHYEASLLVFMALYTFKQTFCIPGSFALNLLAGALFGTVHGLLLTVCLTSFGTSLCYVLAARLGVGLRKAKVFGLGSKILTLERHVENARQRGDLFFFLLSMRVFPFAPQWLITLVSPLSRVPFTYHASSIFIGLLPYNFLSVRAGAVIHDLTSSSEAFDIWTMLQLAGIALLAVLPTVLQKRPAAASKKSLEQVL